MRRLLSTSGIVLLGLFSGSSGLQELHYRYYEPLCQELSSLDKLLAGPPVKKLLFMTDAQAIATQHEPHWKVAYLTYSCTSTINPSKKGMLSILSVKNRLAQRTTKQLLEANQSHRRLWTQKGKPLLNLGFKDVYTKLNVMPSACLSEPDKQGLMKLLDAGSSARSRCRHNNGGA